MNQFIILKFSRNCKNFFSFIRRFLLISPLLLHKSGQPGTCLRALVKGVMHMQITQSINMDLVHPCSMPRLTAVQGDSGTRLVAISLFCEGEAWPIPAKASARIRYRKPDGTGGSYDTTPEGKSAWQAKDNVLTVELTRQMLAVPGCVIAQAELELDTEILATFSFQIIVEENPAADIPASADYINWAGWLEAQLQKQLEQLQKDGTFTGATPQLQIGTVTTLPQGSEASASIRGSAEYPLLDLNLPRGGEPTLDATLTQTRAAAQAAAVGEQLRAKAPLSLVSSHHTAASDSTLNSVLGENQNAVTDQSLRFFTVSLTAETAIGSGTWLMGLYRENETTAYVMGYPIGGNLCAPVRRIKKNGLWSSWEFDAPALSVGSTYRTSRRYKGKPVFRKTVAVPALPDNSNAEILLGAHNGSKWEVCDLRLILHNGSNIYWVNPWDVQGYNLRYYCYDNGSNWYLKVETAGNLTGWSGTCIFEYIQP